MEEESAAASGTAGSASAEAEADKDDDERELEKLENNDPEMLRVCIVILEQLDNFKVRLCADLTNFEVVNFFVFFGVSICFRLTSHLLALICLCVYIY